MGKRAEKTKRERERERVREREFKKRFGTKFASYIFGWQLCILWTGAQSRTFPSRRSPFDDVII